MGEARMIVTHSSPLIFKVGLSYQLTLLTKELTLGTPEHAQVQNLQVIPYVLSFWNPKNSVLKQKVDSKIVFDFSVSFGDANLYIRTCSKQ